MLLYITYILMLTQSYLSPNINFINIPQKCKAQIVKNQLSSSETTWLCRSRCGRCVLPGKGDTIKPNHTKLSLGKQNPNLNYFSGAQSGRTGICDCFSRILLGKLSSCKKLGQKKSTRVCLVWMLLFFLHLNQWCLFGLRTWSKILKQHH